jgi:hypothetical protein
MLPEKSEAAEAIPGSVPIKYGGNMKIPGIK